MQGINKNIFDYFNELKINNNRDWFNKNKERFLEHQEEVKDFSSEIQIKLNKQDDIDKVKVFRIYRDVRFSKDKTPYKTHFGVSFNRNKPYLRGGYYIHIQPDSSFIATGFWNPNKEDLLRIRKEIEVDGEELEKIINSKKLNLFGDPLKGMRLKPPQKDLIKTTPTLS